MLVGNDEIRPFSVQLPVRKTNSEDSWRQSHMLRLLKIQVSQILLPLVKPPGNPNVFSQNQLGTESARFQRPSGNLRDEIFRTFSFQEFIEPSGKVIEGLRGRRRRGQLR